METDDDPPSHPQSPAAARLRLQTMTPKISNDELIQILARLPVKSLCKFKCVSKEWLGIITDPHFVSLHRDLASRNPNVVVVQKRPNFPSKQPLIRICTLNIDGTTKNSDFSFPVDDHREGINVLSSKGDLICVVSNNRYYVCNPSTQEMKKLPKAAARSRSSNPAMGFINGSREYVFLHLSHIYGSQNMKCEVLRLRDGEDSQWKPVAAICPFLLDGCGVFVDNVFYWKSAYEYSGPGDTAIVSFDLEKQEFGTLDPHEGFSFIEDEMDESEEIESWYGLVELGGRLCFVDNMASFETMEVWILEDPEKQAWVRRYTIDISMYPVDLLDGPPVHPLELWGDGRILMDASPESLDCYHVGTGEIERMVNAERPGRLEFCDLEMRRGHPLVAEEWNWVRLYTPSFFKVGKSRR